MKSAEVRLERMGGKRAVAALLTLLGFLTVLGPAAAQDTEMERFEGELYDYAIAWDSNIWPNYSSYSWEGQEQIEMHSGATTLTLHAYEADADDTGDCLRSAQRLRERADGIENVEVADDLSLPIERGGVEGIVLTYDMEVAGRGQVAIAEYVGCALLEESGSVLEISVLTRAGIYDEEIEIAEAVLGTLELPNETPPCGCIDPDEEGAEAAFAPAAPANGTAFAA